MNTITSTFNSQVTDDRDATIVVPESGVSTQIKELTKKGRDSAKAGDLSE